MVFFTVNFVIAKVNTFCTIDVISFRGYFERIDTQLVSFGDVYLKLQREERSTLTKATITPYIEDIKT